MENLKIQSIFYKSKNALHFNNSSCHKIQNNLSNYKIYVYYLHHTLFQVDRNSNNELLPSFDRKL